MASFQVKLSAQPSSTVNVTVSRVSGDTDITVQSGANLTFTVTNWDTFQPVTLAAAEDVDISNGSATIRISASGIPNKNITATEADNDTLTFITSAATVTVPEGGTQSFQVKLSAQPGATKNAAVSRVSGDSDITVQSGSNLAFTTANWDMFQTVTLAAAEDADVANGSATIKISATGVPDKDVAATEVDNDTLTFVTSADAVTVSEGGTQSFRVKLSAQPSSTVNVAVSRVSGDSDITVQSGSNLTFTMASWDTFQAVTLAAVEDADSTDGSAVVRVSATGIPNKDVTATESDNDTAGIIFVELTGICGGNNPCFTSVQQAIDAVGSNATIRVAQGIYGENVVVSSSTRFNLQGGWNADFSDRLTDPKSTVLDGDENASVITFSAGNGVAIDAIIERFTIQDGSAQNGGGISGHVLSGGMLDVKLTGAIIRNNTSTISGGGVGVYAKGPGSVARAQLTNNVIHGNDTGGDGAGIYVFSDSAGSATMTLMNNTISDNVAKLDGGGLRVHADGGAANATVKNSIIWGNLALGGHDIAARQELGGVGTVTASFSNIGDVWPDADAPGSYTDLGNNIDADPKFLNLAAGDLSLGATSPAVDLASANGAPADDIEGNARPLGMDFDMGAHERLIPLGGPVVISARKLPVGDIGVAYIAALGASGGQPPYTYSVTPALPCGLTLIGDKIAGVPCLVGKKPFSIRVTDQVDASASKKYSYSTVKEVAISNLSLPKGKAGRKYAGKLKASGGTKPYKWSLVSSEPLPPGLSLNPLNGKITGKPATRGNFNLKFRVRDGTTGEHETTLILVIN
jgi:hypothetical protein